MKVIRVNKEDFEILNEIVTNLLDDSDEQPTIEHLAKLLTDDRTYLFAAIIDAKVVGYTLAYRFPSLYESGYLAYLYDIEVLESDRRKGVGRSLIKELLSQLKSNEVSELWLGTATDNVAAQSLFRSTGGIKSGETFNDFTFELI